METIVQSRQQLGITEDSSDRSESSNMSQEYQTRGFDDYDIVKRLKQSVGEQSVAMNEQSSGKIVAASKQYQRAGLQFDEVNVSIGKSKEFGFITEEQIGDALNYQMDKTRESDLTMETSQICRSKEPTVKETFLNLSRDARHKYINGNFDRSPKELNYLVEREIKEYGLAKGYNLPLDRMKEFNLPLDRMRDSHGTVLPRERLSGVGLLDNARILEAANHRNLHMQPRSPQDLETMDYERMRRHHLLNRMDFAAQNLVGSQLPHSRQSSVAQLQQTQQQQQQQQQQIKSFTIDAILAHRNNQRERHQRNQQQQQLRKAARQECQEVTAKSGGSCSGNSGGGSGGGKAKRVRTIFTAEQLERLEGEFARQQYMVGPERLYLAHALRLTEAQVKVWFQNRRIKWRKVNHEQQCQAVNEHRQRCSLPSLEIHEDESNETNGKWCNSAIAATIAAAGEDSRELRELRELRPSSVVKP